MGTPIQTGILYPPLLKDLKEQGSTIYSLSGESVYRAVWNIDSRYTNRTNKEYWSRTQSYYLLNGRVLQAKLPNMGLSKTLLIENGFRRRENEIWGLYCERHWVNLLIFRDLHASIIASRYDDYYKIRSKVLNEYCEQIYNCCYDEDVKKLIRGILEKFESLK